MAGLGPTAKVPSMPQMETQPFFSKSTLAVSAQSGGSTLKISKSTIGIDTTGPMTLKLSSATRRPNTPQLQRALFKEHGHQSTSMIQSYMMLALSNFRHCRTAPFPLPLNNFKCSF
jgi:hypothetical protein